MTCHGNTVWSQLPHCENNGLVTAQCSKTCCLRGHRHSMHLSRPSPVDS